MTARKVEQESECQSPCDPQVECDECAGYWARMEHLGLWVDGRWADRGIAEMLK